MEEEIKPSGEKKKDNAPDYNPYPKAKEGLKQATPENMAPGKP